MRRRWILSWKGPETQGGPKRAKARLVVLGFEDPDLSSTPNDAPVGQGCTSAQSSESSEQSLEADKL